MAEHTTNLNKRTRNFAIIMGDVRTNLAKRQQLQLRLSKSAFCKPSPLFTAHGCNGVA